MNVVIITAKTVMLFIVPNILSLLPLLSGFSSFIASSIEFYWVTSLVNESDANFHVPLCCT